MKGGASKKKDTDATDPQLYICKEYGRAQHNPVNIRRECEILFTIDHPHVARIVDFRYDVNNSRCLAKLYVEFCSAGDLSLYQKSDLGDPRLDWRVGLQVFEQLSGALLYIHHGVYRTQDYIKALEPPRNCSTPAWQTIFHRDIKPENGKTKSAVYLPVLTAFLVFIAFFDDDRIIVKLGDFGLAKYETDGTNTYVGSARYMAPV